MPHVEQYIVLKADLEEVWNELCDVASFPERVATVRDVKVLEEGGDWTVSSWEVELRGSILKWVERATRDENGRRVRFEQVEGDLEYFAGWWSLEDLGDGRIAACGEVDFEIGIPMLKEMLDPVASEAISDNVRVILESLGTLENHAVAAPEQA